MDGGDEAPLFHRQGQLDTTISKEYFFAQNNTLNKLAT